MIRELTRNDEMLKESLVSMLKLENDTELQFLYQNAREVRREHAGDRVYLRGLIEISNRCVKNCFYCGIRAGNAKVSRYEMEEEEIMQCVRFADEMRLGSVVLQSGERADKSFVEKIDRLVKRIVRETDLRITLSCGEQTEEIYRRWFESGARRYLLRIETSNESLFRRIHPDDDLHSMERRIEALRILKKTGYQTGTGVMIGLPGQTAEDLAEDLLFFQKMDVDMVGMGPYIEHPETPLAHSLNKKKSLQERLTLTLKMIALLRLTMKNINIATATALQAIHPDGREMAIRAGANVFMPNITPARYCGNYNLYENKPFTLSNGHEVTDRLKQLEKLGGIPIAWNANGDSKHWKGLL